MNAAEVFWEFFTSCKLYSNFKKKARHPAFCFCDALACRVFLGARHGMCRQDSRGPWICRSNSQGDAPSLGGAPGPGCLGNRGFLLSGGLFAQPGMDHLPRALSLRAGTAGSAGAALRSTGGALLPLQRAFPAVTKLSPAPATVSLSAKPALGNARAGAAPWRTC